jgi:hypothetical protein
VRQGRTSIFSPRSAFLAAFACASVFQGQGICKKPDLPAPYLVLRSVQAPYELVFSHFPAQYTVPITLSGAISDEMKKTLKGMGLEAPSYEEVLDKSRQFHLFLANKNYSLETRDLLSGVLNPVEMIDIVVSSALKYRQEEQFRAIANETSITITSRQAQGKTMLSIVLVPRGKYFAYSYEDLGAYIRESWLSTVICVMDSASHCVYELTLYKNSRTFTADQTRKPPVDSSVLHYAFSYAQFDGALLPAALSLCINGAPSLALEATYRREGKYLLFDTRKICYINPKAPGGDSSCLMMNYGAYDINRVPPSLKQSVAPQAYAKSMEKAAELSRKALALIRKGSLDAAMAVLKKVVADFPETPQAVEARKLLYGLPGGTGLR